MLEPFTRNYARLQAYFNYVHNTWHLESMREIEKLKAHAVIPLNRFEHKIYSQNGEDGIIREIFKRIGTTSKTFFEFGAGAGNENNTIALLIDDWTGWWIDAGDHVETYRKNFAEAIKQKKLVIARQMVTSGNINSIMQGLAIPKEVDLLAIDIDGNDYYVWEMLTATSPRVVIIEYNAAYPPGMHFLQTESAAPWDGSNCFGASLHTINELARMKGYTLVCCELIGANAFFVRDDLVGDKFEFAGDVGKIWQTPKYYLHYYAGHMPYINDRHIAIDKLKRTSSSPA